MKKIIILLLAFIVAIAPSYGAEDFSKAKQIVDAKTPCSQLADEQLEDIGEYYMEQMHPGEAHELMHKMMGLEEGSKVEEQFHINMAKRLYCNDVSGISNYGIMGMMSGGMMGIGGGMMNMATGGMMGNFGYGMMGNTGYGFGYWSFLNILSLLLLIGLVALVYLWIIKLLKDIKTKGKK